MILHDKKLVFIHVPKTGGTSLSRFLEPYCDKDSLKFSPYDKEGNQHARITDYIDAYGKNILEDYTFFSIIRNPFERALSNALYQNNNTFDREFFKKVLIEWAALGLAPHSHFYFYMKFRTFSTPEMMEDEKGPMYTLENADDRDELVPLIYGAIESEEQLTEYRRLIHLPFVLRFENYASDVAAFFDRYDIKYCSEDLKKKTNSTTHKHYSYYYQPAEAAILRFQCALDMQVFKYQYEDKREFNSITREEIYK